MSKDMKNDEVFIIGGGPSLKGFDFNLLKDKNTICINQAVFDVPNPNCLITCDYTFIKKVGRENINELKCRKIFVVNLYGEELEKREDHSIKDMYIDKRHNIIYNLLGFSWIIEAKGANGLGFHFDNFYSGSNSGYSGFQLAIIFGYKNIYLLGFDLQFNKNITHYHNKYSVPIEKFKERLERYYNTFKIGFELLTKHDSSVKVFNCSVNSRLKSLIPTVDLSKML